MAEIDMKTKYEIWAIVIFYSCLACFVSSCSEQVKPSSPSDFTSVRIDLDSIKKRGYLTVLTENSASTYFIYRNQPKGFDFELADAFARSIGVKLEIQILDNVDKMFEMLNQGKGDIIAANLTLTEEREKIVSFTKPFYQTRQVLVQQIMKRDSVENTIIDDFSDLGSVPVFVHRYSSFYERLREIEGEYNLVLDIHEAPGGISTDDLLRLVNDGEMRATVTDENLALMQFDDYSNIDISFAITEAQDIAWAVRKNSPALEEAINHWLGKRTTKRKVAGVYNKYFKEVRQDRGLSKYVMPKLQAGSISPYDSLFKSYASQIGWDWRMLAALAYQESRFNPDAISWSGATGLMQMMPQTANRFGCDSLFSPECSIDAAVKYIKYLQGIWRQKIHDPEERTKFVLASYNIGQGHVLDAYNLAREIGKADTIWDGNVAEALLLKQQEKYYSLPVVKHGYCYAKEPFHFVGKIFALFEHYKMNP